MYLLVLDYDKISLLSIHTYKGMGKGEITKTSKSWRIEGKTHSGKISNAASSSTIGSNPYSKATSHACSAVRTDWISPLNNEHSERRQSRTIGRTYIKVLDWVGVVTRLDGIRFGLTVIRPSLFLTKVQIPHYPL